MNGKVYEGIYREYQNGVLVEIPCCVKSINKMTQDQNNEKAFEREK